jgi:hypothetical protein
LKTNLCDARTCPGQLALRDVPAPIPAEPMEPPATARPVEGAGFV